GDTTTGGTYCSRRPPTWPTSPRTHRTRSPSTSACPAAIPPTPARAPASGTGTTSTSPAISSAPPQAPSAASAPTTASRPPPTSHPRPRPPPYPRSAGTNSSTSPGPARSTSDQGGGQSSVMGPMTGLAYKGLSGCYSANDRETSYQCLTRI